MFNLGSSCAMNKEPVIEPVIKEQGNEISKPSAPFRKCKQFIIGSTMILIGLYV